MDLIKYPQWFINSFLDFYKLLQNRKELIKSSRAAVRKGDEITSGCLLTKDFSKLIFFSRRTQKNKKPQFIKYTHILNEQEKENLSEDR